MVWRRLFHQENNEPDDPRADETPRNDEASPSSGTVQEGRPQAMPPHLERQLGARRRQRGTPEDLRRRLATLERRRTATLYDIEQGELAASENNPWKQRIRLLSEALETVEQDYASAEQVEPGPFHAVSDTAITDTSVTVENDVATVRYRVGDNAFTFEEPLDWAERGHQITRMELRQVSGNVSTLVPRDTPAELRDGLHHHLSHSLFVLATVLRDRTLDEEPLPDSITVADLARPCPTCGGWIDYRGRCQYCAQRTARLQELFRERTRLLNDRAAEIEEQHRMVEGLPLARRRLADVETEIATIKEKIVEQAED